MFGILQTVFLSLVFSFIFAPSIYAQESQDIDCCGLSAFAQAKNAVMAPEFMGKDKCRKDAFGSLDHGVPCILMWGRSEDKKGCMTLPLCGLLGSGSTRCGDVKSCLACGPLCLAGVGAGCGKNVFASAASPLACIMCSCGEVQECDICCAGFGGGVAKDKEGKLGKDGIISWLCCFGVPIQIWGKDS